MQRSENHIKRNPAKQYQHRSVVTRDPDIRLSGFDIISCKLLLTARTFKLRWKEAQYHLHNKDYPYDPYYNRRLFKPRQYRIPTMNMIPYIKAKQYNKQDRAVAQPEVMQQADNC